MLNKKNVIILGFLGGILISILTSFYIESLSGLIYSLKELKFIIKSKFLKEIDINENIEESLELISNNLKQNNKIKNLGLFFISDLTDENINKFKTNINRFYDELNIVISNDFSNDPVGIIYGWIT